MNQLFLLGGLGLGVLAIGGGLLSNILKPSEDAMPSGSSSPVIVMTTSGDTGSYSKKEAGGTTYNVNVEAPDIQRTGSVPGTTETKKESSEGVVFDASGQGYSTAFPELYEGTVMTSTGRVSTAFPEAYTKKETVAPVTSAPSWFNPIRAWF